MNIISYNPSHDGAIAYLKGAQLLVSIEAEKNSNYRYSRRCCMIQLRREWGRFSNFSFRTPQRRISAYPARPSG